MDDITKKVSYIFRYKEGGEERKEGQLFILSYLRKCFPNLEIIVVEQGEKQTLFLPEEWNIKFILEEYSGIFNRCRPYNIGARSTDRPILAFGDGDIFLKKEDYLSCFAATDTFEAITPNKDVAINVKIDNAEAHTFSFLNKRRILTFAGGLLILTREAFEKIGGWDERFIAWGHEDVVMSYLIFQVLKSKTFFMDFYHINHPRVLTDTDKHSDININQVLREEIETFSGHSIDNYIKILKEQQLPSPLPKKNKKFILAVSSRNGLKHLKTLVHSFLKTKSPDADWTLLIADNGTEDEVRQWVKDLQIDCPIVLIENDEVSTLRQENSILKKLSEMDFDLCFKSSDEIVFSKSGWEELYWQTIQKTAYDHLVFYDTSREAVQNPILPISRGDLIAHCPFDYTQGLFYTLSPRVIKRVGFMNEQELLNGGIIDYILRCCRAGFNILQYPFDVKDSNAFISIQAEEKQDLEVIEKRYSRTYLKNIFPWRFKKIVHSNQIFLAYQENDLVHELHDLEDIKYASEDYNSPPKLPEKCDASYHPGRGISGIIGFLVRKFYNFGVHYRLYFIPRSIKKVGEVFNKIGEDLSNINDK